MVIVRVEKPGDAQAIRLIHAAAFPTKSEAVLVDALRSSERLLISMVAEKGGLVIGHIAFSPVSVAGSSAAVGLGPVAVMPACQRQGIGGMLIREALAACAESGFGFVVVLGEPAYYARFGFVPAFMWGLQDEYQGGPAFQALELVSGAIPPNAGLVRYAPEFSIVANDVPHAETL